MRIINLFACASVAVISLQACNKSDIGDTRSNITLTTSTQTVTAEVQQNGSYTLTLPPTVSGYSIVTDASHASLSKVAVNPNGTESYDYAPIADYVGTEALVLVGNDTTTVSPNEGGGGCNKGHNNSDAPAQKQHVKQQRINLNITVAPTTTPTS